MDNLKRILELAGIQVNESENGGPFLIQWTTGRGDKCIFVDVDTEDMAWDFVNRNRIGGGDDVWVQQTKLPSGFEFNKLYWLADVEAQISQADTTSDHEPMNSGVLDKLEELLDLVSDSTTDSKVNDKLMSWIIKNVPQNQIGAAANRCLEYGFEDLYTIIRSRMGELGI